MLVDLALNSLLESMAIIRDDSIAPKEEPRGRSNLGVGTNGEGTNLKSFSQSTTVFFVNEVYFRIGFFYEKFSSVYET
jgi:hypothetical protein